MGLDAADYDRSGRASIVVTNYENELPALYQNRSDAEKVLLCVGIGYGEVLRVGDTDIYGAEVNAACKLGEDIARAHEILITGAGAREARLPEGVTKMAIDNAPAGTDSAYRLVYDCQLPG